MDTFDYFSDLPTPVLYNVLLILEPKELQSIIGNRRVLSIVKLSEFKRLYNNKHSSFLTGKRKYIRNPVFGSPYIHIIDDGLETIIYDHNSLVYSASFILGKHSIDMSYAHMKTGDSFFIGIQEHTLEHYIKWICTDTWREKERSIKYKNRILESLRVILERRNKLEWMPWEENGTLKISNDFPTQFKESMLKALRMYK